MKKAVILFNLGGPDSLESIQPFLFNLFNDPAIISIPTFFRYLLAKLIAYRRAPIAKSIYKVIGNKSPILELTNQQSKSLENNLLQSGPYKCFVVMRCWHPRASDVIKKVKEYNPEEIILLPLYPQFSATTSGSSINEWIHLCKKENYNIKTKTICCYPTEDYFISAHTILLKKAIEQATSTDFKLIFSAHGLPERKIKKGDPYQWQNEQTVKYILLKIGRKNLDHVLSYQSKVGPLKWIGPSTEEEIIKSSKLKKGIIIVPIAFVSEHSETLVELDIKYKKLAFENGCTFYIRVPTLGTNKVFINGLAKLVLKSLKKDEFIYPVSCPDKFIKCPCLGSRIL